MPSKKRCDDALIWLMTDLKDRPLLIGFVNNGPADLMGLSLLLVTAAFSNFLWRLFDDPDRKPLRVA
jgi:hypothetical protein